MLDKSGVESVKDKLKALMPKKGMDIDSMSEEIGTEQSKGKRIANTVINVILVIAIILAAVCTYVSFVSTSGNGVPSILGVRVFSIQTKSMYPTLEPGDLIFDSAVKDSSDLEIGDIITYWTVIDGQRVLNTHRIVQIYDGGGYRIFETQGDNNTIADALTVHESEIVGVYNGKRLPGVGKVFDYLQTSTGFLLVVVIPVAIFFLYHLIQFFRVLFEYNNIKNKLLYEQERGRTEDLVEDEKKKMETTRKQERERLEQELREKLKSEILAANGITAAPAVEVPVREVPVAPVKNEKPTLAEERAAMEARIRAEIEAKAIAEEEARVRAEAEARERAEVEARERAEVEAKIRAEMEAEARAKAEAERLAAERAEMEARIRAEMEAEARAKAEAERLAAERAEMEARIRAEMEAEARAKAEVEAKAKAEAERRAAMEAEIRAKIKAEMEAEAKAKAEAAQG